MCKTAYCLEVFGDITHKHHPIRINTHKQDPKAYNKISLITENVMCVFAQIYSYMYKYVKIQCIFAMLHFLVLVIRHTYTLNIIYYALAVIIMLL